MKSRTRPVAPLDVFSDTDTSPFPTAGVGLVGAHADIGLLTVSLVEIVVKEKPVRR